ncbi:DUF3515 domain-containing protein [Nocardia salmonicida]|uniref:DUF3515 domain-containing protein n=1 Tax=Nocardia salmonicida TaxID=53431 RepID=UPI0009EECC65|nr:DUF3515 domain-containing protein [Nocardia salmonicida]
MADSTPEDRDEASTPDDTATADAASSGDEPTSATTARSADATAEDSAPADDGSNVDSDAESKADSDDDDDDDNFESHHSPALIATAVALPVVLIVAVLVAAFIALRAPVEREPLALGPVPAPAADGPACQALLPALPAELGDYTKATLVEPSPPATRAWQLPDGGDPITLRCGLDRPLEFNRASPLTVIDGVKWFQVRDEVGKTGTWFAVDRETYIALTVPDGSGTSAVQNVSDIITANLPAREPTPGEL